MVPPGPCTCGFSTSTIPPLSSVASPGAAVCPPNGARPPVKIGIDGRGPRPAESVQPWPPACIVSAVPKLGRLSWKTWLLARPSESKLLGVGVRLAPCLQSPSSPEAMNNTFSNEKRRLCYRKWLMLFPLKLQRNNRQNALAVEPAKGKTGKKLYFHRTVKLKQPHTNRAKKEAPAPQRKGAAAMPSSGR